MVLLCKKYKKAKPQNNEHVDIIVEQKTKKHSRKSICVIGFICHMMQIHVYLFIIEFYVWHRFHKIVYELFDDYGI